MKHEPKIYLIDIDGTLTNEVCFHHEECVNATPNQKMIDWVNDKYKTDFIIIYTARRNDLYQPTIDWLAKYGVKYHATQFQKTPGVIVDLDSINKVEEL